MITSRVAAQTAVARRGGVGTVCGVSDSTRNGHESIGEVIDSMFDMAMRVLDAQRMFVKAFVSVMAPYSAYSVAEEANRVTREMARST
jgi:hypothetical protein